MRCIRWSAISALMLLALTGRSRADDSLPDRRLGGCFSNGTICAGPSASASFVVLDLTSGTSKGGFVPGAGYGLTFFADKWYNVGTAMYLSYVTGNDIPSTLTPTLVLSFAEYVRIGFGFEHTDKQSVSEGGAVTPSKTDLLLVLGLGIDIGATPASKGKGIAHAVGLE